MGYSEPEFFNFFFVLSFDLETPDNSYRTRAHSPWSCHEHWKPPDYRHVLQRYYIAL